MEIDIKGTIIIDDKDYKSEEKYLTQLLKELNNYIKTKKHIKYSNIEIDYGDEK